MNRIAIIDYALGNLLSLERAVNYCGGTPLITADPREILSADRILLPGVGAFGFAMKKLESTGLNLCLKKAVQQKKLILGICLGMQLLFDESEEFELTKGLSLLPGRVVKIPRAVIDGDEIKVPHIGWNELTLTKYGQKSFLRELPENNAFYFTHSYMVIPAKEVNVLANCLYGSCLIASVIQMNTVYGCQFHPEKSGETGLYTLRKFIQGN